MPPPSLAELLDWVSQRLDDPITLDDMAIRLHVSSRTLIRRFAEQLGTSPGQWLLVRRINAARTLLEETDLPVDVAHSGNATERGEPQRLYGSSCTQLKPRSTSGNEAGSIRVNQAWILCPA